MELGRHPDAYSLLDGDYTEQAERYRLFGIALHSTGWAAPLNENGDSDCRPSEHPDRVRMATVMTMTMFGYCVAIAFADERETTFVEAPAPGGPLQSAMVGCMLRMMGA